MPGDRLRPRKVRGRKKRRTNRQELSQQTEVAHLVAKGDPYLGGSYADTGGLRHVRGLT
jgi:hypothetical protein